MTELSIIVISWNTRELLTSCLNSIYAYTSNLDIEVIVVDNASTDGSPEMVAADYPHVILLRNEQNIGFGRANNQAFALARGKFIGLLNSDAALLNRAFELLVSCLNSMPSVGIIGPVLLKESGEIDRACAREFINLRTEFLSATGLSDWFATRFDIVPNSPYHYDVSQMVDCLSGACLLIRREALVENQIFDPTFFMYGEDVDLCYGIKARDWGIFFFPDARVLHHGKASTNQNSGIPLQALYSHNLFISKAYGWPAAMLHRGMWLIALIARYLGTLLVLLANRRIRNQPEWVYRRHYYPKLIVQWVLGIEKPT